MRHLPVLLLEALSLAAAGALAVLGWLYLWTTP